MPSSSTPAPREYSLVILKPDAVRKGICLHVLYRIVHGVQEGRIRASKIFHFTPELLRRHYGHVPADVYPRVERFMLSSEVWAAVIEGASGTIQRIRDIIGATDPRKAAPGTIRHQFGEVVGGEIYNVAHASGNPEEAFAEIRRFFPEEEIRNVLPEIADQICAHLQEHQQ